VLELDARKPHGSSFSFQDPRSGRSTRCTEASGATWLMVVMWHRTVACFRALDDFLVQCFKESHDRFQTPGITRSFTPLLEGVCMNDRQEML
jgi:hypothetical protein